jgi:hypothetical protein
LLFVVAQLPLGHLHLHHGEGSASFCLTSHDAHSHPETEAPSCTASCQHAPKLCLHTHTDDLVFTTATSLLQFVALEEVSFFDFVALGVWLPAPALVPVVVSVPTAHTAAAPTVTPQTWVAAPNARGPPAKQA